MCISCTLRSLISMRHLTIWHCVTVQCHSSTEKKSSNHSLFHYLFWGKPDNFKLSFVERILWVTLKFSPIWNILNHERHIVEKKGKWFTVNHHRFSGFVLFSVTGSSPCCPLGILASSTPCMASRYFSWTDLRFFFFLLTDLLGLNLLANLGFFTLIGLIGFFLGFVGSLSLCGGFGAFHVRGPHRPSVFPLRLVEPQGFWPLCVFVGLPFPLSVVSVDFRASFSFRLKP